MLVFHFVAVVLLLEVADEAREVDGADDPAAIKGTLALLDQLGRVGVGRVHGDALFEVRQGALFLVQPIQGATDAVVPQRVGQALRLDAVQQLHGAIDVLGEGIHVRLRVVNVGARQQTRELVAHRCWRQLFDQCDDLLMLTLVVQGVDPINELCARIHGNSFVVRPRVMTKTPA